MSATPRVRPVSRLRVLAGALVLLAVLAGVAGLAELLRPPDGDTPLAPLPPPDDPREEVVCPPSPRPGSDPVPVSSGDLLDCPASFDGYTVAYEGEVVGAVLRRAEGAWVQLNDDAYGLLLGPLPGHRQFAGGNSGLGVHVPAELADAVDWIGGHDARGDVLAVVGTYHQSDAASGEVAVIRAHAGEVVRRGTALTHARLEDRQLAAVLAGLAALALLGAGRLAARRR